jgi:hypothetical protein
MDCELKILNEALLSQASQMQLENIISHILSKHKQFWSNKFCRFLNKVGPKIIFYLHTEKFIKKIYCKHAENTTMLNTVHHMYL